MRGDSPHEVVRVGFRLQPGQVSARRAHTAPKDAVVAKSPLLDILIVVRVEDAPKHGLLPTPTVEKAGPKRRRHPIDVAVADFETYPSTVQQRSSAKRLRDEGERKIKVDIVVARRSRGVGNEDLIDARIADDVERRKRSSLETHRTDDHAE